MHSNISHFQKKYVGTPPGWGCSCIRMGGGGDSRTRAGISSHSPHITAASRARNVATRNAQRPAQPVREWICWVSLPSGKGFDSTPKLTWTPRWWGGHSPRSPKAPSRKGSRYYRHADKHFFCL